MAAKQDAEMGAEIAEFGRRLAAIEAGFNDRVSRETAPLRGEIVSLHRENLLLRRLVGYRNETLAEIARALGFLLG